MKIKRRKQSKIKLLLAPAVLLVAGIIIAAINQTKQVDALSNFNPGNIMSDYVMSDYTTMTETEIQTFLKSKNHCNDTNVSKAAKYPHLRYNIRDGHFVCMADEDFNGESAAHIIWQAAQDYRINPQVLIVLLQKEQGLVTDTWPNHIQYRSATGYGCPDTAPCDAQYYGLRNQIRMAARLFRTVLDGGWTNYPVGKNYVLYNPNRACGGSTINIENRATSALYRYTPYQPNASALAAGYGTAHCGAYGNRNFYLYFTNWFGSTQYKSDLPYEQMDVARIMRVKTDTSKVNLKNMSKSNQILKKGREIKFVSKITLNDVLYLRTEHDTIARANYGIPFSDLEEIRYEDLKEPVYKILPPNTPKYNPTNPSAQTHNINSNRAIKFTQKITVNNKTYLRTAFDQTNNHNAAILQKDLKEVKFEPFLHPRFMRLTQNSNKTHLYADASDNEVFLKDQQFMFTSKISAGQKTYYRTESDTKENRLLVFDASDVSNNKVEKLQYNVAYRTNSKQGKYNHRTLSVSGNFPTDLVRYMTDRVFVNGNWYYRTEWDQRRNNSAFFKDSGLEIVFDNMLEPRMMRSNAKAEFIDLGSGKPINASEAKLDLSPKNTTHMFTTKAYTNKGMCLRTKEHTEAKQDICILFSNLSNVK